MSYLLAETTVDELLLMVAAQDGRTRPEPYAPGPTWNADTDPYFNFRPPIPAPGMIFLNLPDVAHEAYRRDLIYESPRSYRSMHLTWKGWDRVEDLLASGEALPTDAEMAAYARLARVVIEGGDHELIPLTLPSPEGHRRRWPLRRLAAALGRTQEEGGAS